MHCYVPLQSSADDENCTALRNGGDDRSEFKEEDREEEGVLLGEEGVGSAGERLRKSVEGQRRAVSAER